jgi:hypothetical protein
MNLTVACPTCGKRVVWGPEQRWRPFCSERCKLIDLGEWAAENRAVPGEPAAEDPGEADDLRHPED